VSAFVRIWGFRCWVLAVVELRHLLCHLLFLLDCFRGKRMLTLTFTAVMSMGKGGPLMGD